MHSGWQHGGVFVRPSAALVQIDLAFLMLDSWIRIDSQGEVEWIDEFGVLGS